MAILKCKMCGGDLQIEEGMTVCECEYCGSKQTVPVVDNEKKLNLFARANRLRSACEFDKAFGVYESIVSEFQEEAEAYWGLILCKYGIEYVDDPKTGKKIPTCHRSSFDSIMKDPDFDMVMECSDSTARAVYREEAKTIEDIRVKIIDVSSKEEPYDIFICYKETAEDGQRTIDSVIAQDVYKALTEEGYRVFFSRISLEDKLGQEYEPYIFAALNSAKVMLAFGTDYEYYNAVWVKNEWSRFLSLIEKGEKKTLIPCYKDIDAYDMPEEFKKLQAQDMGKVGAIQDLVRGIEKILSPKTNEYVYADSIQKIIDSGDVISTFTKRGNIALEDLDWIRADEFFEQVLNLDTECAEAYLGKLMSRYKQANIAALKKYYISKYEACDVEYLEACEEAMQHIEQVVSKYVVEGYLSENEIKRQYNFDRIYASKSELRNQQKAQQISEFESEKLLVRARQYATGKLKDSIEEMINDVISVLNQRIEDAKVADNESIVFIKKQYESFLKDIDVKVQTLYDDAVKRKDEDISHSIKRKRVIGIITIVIAVGIIVSLVISKIIVPNTHYNGAIILMNSGEYQEAIKTFEKLDGFKEAETYIEKCETSVKTQKYNFAIELLKKGDYEEAIDAFTNLNGFDDSDLLLKIAQIKKSSVGDILFLGDYKGNKEWIVLDKQDSRVLLISKYAVCQRNYNIGKSDKTTWERCELRAWLNNDFLLSSFTKKEQSLLADTIVVNNGDIVDKVFLLSSDEATKYFLNDEERQATLVDGTPVFWWLRTNGYGKNDVSDVLKNGEVDLVGNRAENENGAVRPAMWIDFTDYDVKE